jgi:Tfp pilus assembly protein PilO
MKKLTRLHAILIIVLLVVLVAAVYFSFSYRDAQAKQPDIKSEIVQALAQLEVIKEENDPEPWEKQLNELQSVLDSLQRERPLFPERPATVEIGDLIVDTVERLNLTLLRLKSDDEAGTVTIKKPGETEGNKYSKAEYEVRVKGDLGRINSLIGEIEGADFATVTIEDIEITFEEKEEDDRIINWWEGTFTAVTVYQYTKE